MIVSLVRPPVIERDPHSSRGVPGRWLGQHFLACCGKIGTVAAARVPRAMSIGALRTRGTDLGVALGVPRPVLPEQRRAAADQGEQLARERG
jgi:hypothetical protein